MVTTEICWIVWWTFLIGGQPFTGHSSALKTQDAVILQAVNQARKLQNVKESREGSSVALDRIWVERGECPTPKSRAEDEEED